MYLSKRKSRRISTLVTSTLVALFASVILFGQPVYAQDQVEKQESAQEVSIDLLNSKPTLEEKSQLVFDKFDEVQREADEIKDIEKRKEFLSEEIEKLREDLKVIRQQVEEKKAREEAQRLEAIRAEEARQAEARRQAEPARQRATQPVVTQPSPVRSYSYNTAGNTYGYGYCTWYVKNQLSWVPNGLGNANTWFYRAQQMGLSTGTTPRVGAVGTSEAGPLGHVVVVRAVHGDGTITVSEMNYRGWNQISSRTTSASEFRYIYN